MEQNFFPKCMWSTLFAKSGFRFNLQYGNIVSETVDYVHLTDLTNISRCTQQVDNIPWKVTWTEAEINSLTRSVLPTAAALWRGVWKEKENKLLPSSIPSIDLVWVVWCIYIFAVQAIILTEKVKQVHLYRVSHRYGYAFGPNFESWKITCVKK